MDSVANCLRHRRYDEEDAAKDRLKELKVQARNRTLQAYPCKVGGTKHWHIGNPYNRRSKRRRRGRRLGMEIGEIMAALVVAILGGWLVSWLAILVRRAVVRQRELAAKQGAIDSQQELENYIRTVDRALTDAELDSLEQKRKRGED